VINRWIEIEQPLLELEELIDRLEQLHRDRGIDKREEIVALKDQHERLLADIFANLTPWEKTLLARHDTRPYTLDYVERLFTDFTELHGDRRYGDDPALIGGPAFFDGQPVMVIGHQKGRDVKARQFRNFGSAKPEGYRKAQRLMRLAEKLGRPVFSFVDTPAAEARLEAEERGICNAIAESLAQMALLRVPIIVTILGEGGSGGAIGIGIGDRVLMMEHAIYSVIPPEGCAAILDTFGRDARRGPEAAAALRLSAQDLQALGGIIDQVVPEPLGGAHRDYGAAAAALHDALVSTWGELKDLPADQLVEQRYQRLRNLGMRLGPLPEPAPNGVATEPLHTATPEQPTGAA